MSIMEHKMYLRDSDFFVYCLFKLYSFSTSHNLEVWLYIVSTLDKNLSHLEDHTFLGNYLTKKRETISPLLRDGIWLLIL